MLERTSAEFARYLISFTVLVLSATLIGCSPADGVASPGLDSSVTSTTVVITPAATERLNTSAANSWAADVQELVAAEGMTMSQTDAFELEMDSGVLHVELRDDRGHDWRFSIGPWRPGEYSEDSPPQVVSDGPGVPVGAGVLFAHQNGAAQYRAYFASPSGKIVVSIDVSPRQLDSDDVDLVSAFGRAAAEVSGELFTSVLDR